jgi:hypothetical protein
MSFPFVAAENESTEEYNIPKEYQIDFGTGQLTGNLVEGLEAIKMWAFLAINTTRYRHDIYSWDYGCEIEDMIGQSLTQEYLDTEIPRVIEECLTVNPHIKSISNISIALNDDKLSGNFTINTDYGEAEINV